MQTLPASYDHSRHDGGGGTTFVEVRPGIHDVLGCPCIADTDACGDAVDECLRRATGRASGDVTGSRLPPRLSYTSGHARGQTRRCRRQLQRPACRCSSSCSERQRQGALSRDVTTGVQCRRTMRETATERVNEGKRRRPDPFHSGSCHRPTARVHRPRRQPTRRYRRLLSFSHFVLFLACACVAAAAAAAAALAAATNTVKRADGRQENSCSGRVNSFPCYACVSARR